MPLLSSIRVDFENLRSLAFGGISGTYASVGTPFQNPVRTLKLTNFTDANLLISFNGIDNKDVVPANGGWIYDYGANKADAAGTLEQPAGKTLYVKQESSGPTKGTVYLTVIYAAEV